MEQEKKIPFKQKMRNLRRGYGLCHELAPGFVARRCAAQATKILSQYAGIYLSGVIVGIITEKQDFLGAVRAVLWYAGVCLFLDLLMVLFDMPKYEQLNNAFQVKAKMLLSGKCAEMDFVRVENPETHRKKQEAVNYFYGGSSRELGMGKLFYDTHMLFKSFFSVLVGVGICFPALFLKKPTAGGLLGFLQSPFAVLLLFLLCGLLIFWQQKIYGQMQGTLSAYFSDKGRQQEQRIIGFYDDFVKWRYQRGKEIRIYDQSELLIGEWEKHQDCYLNYGKELVKKLHAPDLGRPMLTMAVSVITYAFFIARALSGLNSAAETVVLVMSVGRVLDSVMTMLGMLTDFGFAVVNIGCIFEFLDIPDEKYKGTIPTEKRGDNKYEFAFRDVSFKYPGSEQYVLRNVNLTWRIGEKMALVGRNGSGKSTLVKLLCRLYDPTEGEITLNGIDIRKYDYEEYMALFSVVFQDARLFSFSVAENVAADTVYDGARVEECVRRAGLSERLDAMPQGIETCIYKDFDENGVEISGGEAQKLCLARAVYKGAPFIILDEPTAALDPVSEHDIYTKFNSIVGTRTAVYISHRLSSCRFCDQITVLEEGRIAEQGSHAELLNRNGVYAALWSAQAEYYRDTAGELFA